MQGLTGHESGGILGRPRRGVPTSRCEDLYQLSPL